MNRIVSLIALIALTLVGFGCSQAPATITPTQPNELRAGQGASTATSAAGNARAGVGDQPNWEGGRIIQNNGETKVTVPATDKDGNVIVDEEGNVLMTTVTTTGGIRDFYLGNEIENDSKATISGTTSGTDQSTQQATEADQRPTANTDVKPETDLNFTPGN